MSVRGALRAVPAAVSVAVPVTLGTLVVWQLAVTLADVPAFVLPGPVAVLRALVEHAPALLRDAGVTLAEIVAGLALGAVLGVASAVLLASVEGARRWALPLMVVSQSLPVFALAPILTLWLGYGMLSKIAMATLIIYFPVVAATWDGLRRTDPAMLELGRTLDGSRAAVLLHIRLPAALPSMASGLRVATSVAPIGAVVGEWVGSSHGLGHLMLQANGRMQTDLTFAALACLCAMAVALYVAVDAALDRCLYWVPNDRRPSLPASVNP